MCTVDDLADEIASLAAHLDAATGRLLCCIRGFDKEGGWAKQGAVSCAHWLSWRIGVDLPTAREKVRVARALGSLPGIDEALGRGELSYAKVRALTRVATPDNEQRLLELARHATGAQLERICRAYRQVATSLMDDGPLVEERSVRESLLAGGMVRIELVVHPDEAALIRAAIEKARASLREQRQAAARAGGKSAPVPGSVIRHDGRIAGVSGTEPPENGPCSLAPLTTPRGIDAPLASKLPIPGAVPHISAESAQVSLADAAVHLAESFLASSDAAGAGAGNGGERYLIFVHLDQDLLGDSGDWAATLDDGTRLPAETLRRLACDCGLVVTRTDGSGSVLDVGRRTRRIPPAIRRALWLRDRGCRFPGCGHTRFLHGHHVRHWMAGGETRLDNLVLLCSRHHRVLHEGDCSIERASGDGSLVFRIAGGKSLLRVPPAQIVEDTQADLRAWAAEHEIEIGPDTNLPWWDGAAPDYDRIISSLLSEAAARETGEVNSTTSSSSGQVVCRDPA
jgi:hypothetical protein